MHKASQSTLKYYSKLLGTFIFNNTALVYNMMNFLKNDH